jgi:hypothetical protein
MKIMKSNTLDEGTTAFMQWLNSKEKSSSDNNNSVTLKHFAKGKYVVLVDSMLGNISREIMVEIKGGVPVCGYCKSEDCAHVGFTICVQQLYENRGIANDI